MPVWDAHGAGCFAHGLGELRLETGRPRRGGPCSKDSLFVYCLWGRQPEPKNTRHFLTHPEHSAAAAVLRA